MTRYLALAAVAALSAGVLSAPATAQTTLQELTVTGTSHRAGQPPQRLVERVSFAGLDLTTPDGRKVLEARIRDSAQSICSKLGEAPASRTNLGTSCEEVSISDAMGRAELAYADARSPAYAETYDAAKPGAPESAMAPAKSR
jgi:UrcA family protein